MDRISESAKTPAIAAPPAEKSESHLGTALIIFFFLLPMLFVLMMLGIILMRDDDGGSGI